jgi:thioredoxin-related protein
MRLFLIIIICLSAASCNEPAQEVEEAPFSLEELENRILTQKSYREALFWAKKRNKKVLLYFNGYACVNCSKNRSLNWTKENLTLMDSLYEVVDLKVDDPTPLKGEFHFYSEVLTDSVKTHGDLYLHYQYKHFPWPYQPFYVVIDPNETVLAYLVDHGEIETFGEFSENGHLGHFKSFSLINGLYYNPEYARLLSQHNSVYTADSLVGSFLSLHFGIKSDLESEVLAYHPNQMEADYFTQTMGEDLDMILTDHFGKIKHEITNYKGTSFNLTKDNNNTRFEKYRATQNETAYQQLFTPRNTAIANWFSGTYEFTQHDSTTSVTFNEDYTVSGFDYYTHYEIDTYAHRDILILRTKNFNPDSLETFTFQFTDNETIELKEVENITRKVVPEQLVLTEDAGVLVRD